MANKSKQDKITTKIESVLSDPKDVLKLRGVMLDILDEYNNFLLKNSYTDTDIISEEPTAINQFLEKDAQ